ncbi:uncharacterized protein [Oryza sativa Japonica Group]|uniref:Os09g0380600 protein n=3 Tax=Oryza TaxID=4527 RepID=Q0J241_ORYSJ|nr:uncharacterized protein LOC4346931 [Oryza sativa Japonica Group]KAB8110331.1 hypothetical protein EE612_047478 [Oryza sativa]EAZ44568.1 hypothetical protein OsJ_29189 [Oryza sativa Japonica Group]KAF2915974.1 hypothetical protein DAI22_09g082300 [Oryza sativa Japonica Group]BAD26093.1 unknown protein [Oryza sativa Japonica Group]BAF24971.1 Os09g0380600 [Oryza sativa Japonica Group]|eukprot:NP_001063057.1 Os09g0380600 [Oryza sativa Japonica Group]
MADGSSPSAAAGYPLLVQRSNAGSPAMAFSLSDGKTHDDVSLPEMHSSTYLQTPQGWVLVLSSSSAPEMSTFLLDPRDGRKVGLPPLDESELPTARKCVLSDNAPDAGAGVVVLSLQGPAVWFCRVGGERWSTHTYDMGYFSLPVEYRAPKKRHLFDVAGVGGRFYFCEDKDFSLGTLDFTGDGEVALVAVSVPGIDDIFPSPDSSGIAATYLVESRGDLYLAAVVFLGFRAEGPPHKFSVYRMDFSAAGPAWRRTADIGGDRAFVLGGGGGGNFGASCSASGCGVRANCLYWFNSFSPDDYNLHVLSVGDGGVETVAPPPFEHASCVHKPFWLVPTTNNTA